MNVGSLFSGAGLMDWGLTLAGFDHAWFCESDPYCRSILERRWPDVPIYDDVSVLCAGREVCPPPVDVLAGGFPCQPVSLVGARGAQEDPRWLWPHFERLVRVLRPRYVLVENVPGLLTAGMGDVLGGLAACGYDAEWDCFPAAAFGAPHIRRRIFILAYPGSARRREDAGSASGDEGSNARWAAEDHYVTNRDGQGHTAEHVGDSHRQRFEEQRIAFTATAEGSRLERAGWWRVEPDVGRMAHGVPRRVDRLRALGNGVVPQIAQYVGERILEAERMRAAA